MPWLYPLSSYIAERQVDVSLKKSLFSKAEGMELGECVGRVEYVEESETRDESWPHCFPLIYKGFSALC